MTLGPKSNELQHLRRLSGRRRSRSDAGEFVVDGPTLVIEALESGVRLTRVYAEESADTDVLARVHQAGIAVVGVQTGALAKSTDPVTPQGMAALAAMPVHDLPASGFLLVLVDVADPGNVGTLIRAAEAAGAAGVLLAGDSADAWSPKVVRASAGSVFRVPVSVERDTERALSGLRSVGFRLAATTMTGGTEPDATDLTGDLALVLGNEARGLDPEIVAGADVRITIPMAGRVESLNVAVAGCIVAFAAASQRRRPPGPGMSEGDEGPWQPI